MGLNNVDGIKGRDERRNFCFITRNYKIVLEQSRVS